MFLTRDEIEDLTDAKRRDKQIQWLMDNGVRFVRSSVGRPKVLQAKIERDIQQYLDQRKKNVAENREIKLLSSLYRHAIRWGLCAFNPCEGALYHSEPGRDRYITDDEFNLLKDNADTMLRAIIEFAYLTGERRGDILNLKRKDITEKGVYIRQAKTDKRQLFCMSTELDRVIKDAKRSRKAKNMTYLPVH